ncbi:MAG TPA: thiamine pyrophosphate-binding protein [Trebonia sp.]|jgi:benzoylformate decarboxylase|nr:thiamine pyrophosphate-binding protein [Trebonia sp.]
MTTAPGKAKLIEQFKADGLDTMFGNPGTVEQGLLDAAEHTPGFRYVLSLHETVAVAMAEGYARATGGPALVQLHSGVGLGNAIGMLHQSLHGHTPLVVVAGDSGVRYEGMEAHMAADLVAMARPVTKYATRVTDPGSLLRVMRRAVKVAMTPPRGPVFVALPMDILDEPNHEPVLPATILDTQTSPGPDAVGQGAALLAGAERPIVIVGDEVAMTGAQAELVRLAELLGADVWEADSSEVNMPGSHPLARGMLGRMFGDHTRSLVGQADAVLAVGTYLFPEVFPGLDSHFQPGASVIHVGLDPADIAKNFPVDVGIAANPRGCLAALASELETTMTGPQRSGAQSRLAARRAQTPDGEDGSVLAAVCQAVSAQAGGGLAVFDEALTNSPLVARNVPRDLPGSYFLTRSRSLGVGLPGAVGVKIAHPEQTVVCFSGDGAAMYTFQALWTAARYGIGAKFVICHNGRYHILDRNIEAYWRERDIAAHESPSSFDISFPDIKFADLARSLGVQSLRVDKPEDAATAVKSMLATPEPFLLDVITGTD